MQASNTRSTTPFGGVSAELHQPALKRFVQDADDRAPAAKKVAAAHPNFRNHGGPIVSAPVVHASFWGAAWATDQAHIQRAARLGQFLQDLLAGTYMNILSQYGTGHGPGNAGSFAGSGTIANVPNQLTDANIQGFLQSAIDSGGLPEPAKPARDVVMVYLAEGIDVEGPSPARMCAPSGDNAFGYHHFFTTRAGNPCYYSVIPALDDACLRASCPSDQGCSLHLALTQEQRQTQVSSHEYSEMVTDPEGTGWFDGRSGAENGDICNGESGTITVGSRTWTVQLMYSKHDDVATRGRTTCIASAPQPIPLVK
ncbi:MAG TPA: hypothetical protein VIO84_11945 [Candidatus Dormibacteraeota bacterium]|jgi:hypothetical protein